MTTAQTDTPNLTVQPREEPDKTEISTEPSEEATKAAPVESARTTAQRDQRSEVARLDLAGWRQGMTPDEARALLGERPDGGSTAPRRRGSSRAGRAPRSSSRRPEG